LHENFSFTLDSARVKDQFATDSDGNLPKVVSHAQGSRENEFQRFVTGEESWFTLEFHHSTKWSILRDDIPQKVKPQIGTQKFVLIVIWGIDGFHVVDLMIVQRSYNTQYFLSHVLEPLLLEVFPDRRRSHSRRLSLHFDNCRIHHPKDSENFFAENYIIPVLPPAYSPDLAFSDFWLFEHMKAALTGQQFPG
jgi:hypothetical protein